MSKSSKRRFNSLVNNPVMEDYALRYAPKSFRRWSEFAVASSALGGIAYLADFAIGGSITLSYGFTNALTAILVVAAIIFLTGIPIAYYAARYNIDMDLLTRGAGFGYYGSTLTSLVYASFTFIYFSLEGSVMSQAITAYFGIPLAVSYVIASLLIIPLVIYGMTFLSKLQVWTQPVWLALLVLPLIVIATKDPHAFVHWTHFAGSAGSAGFNALLFGSAAGVVLSLIAQIGEQVDYLRFMPNLTAKNRRAWWWAVILAGPGWVFLGAAKQIGGSVLASYIAPQVGPVKADEPIQMYLHALHLWIPNVAMALTIGTFFVLLSQIKINVTNAYSGSLSWSNFFSRIFHVHPGRVVWLVLNVGIALTLMELGVFGFLGSILGFYSNVAVAWIGAVVADLVINKPLLKVSPSYIEFKRGHLYNFNPVGFGAMVIASAVSIAAYFGLFGKVLSAFSPFLSLGLAFVLSPIIAVLTHGRYYIARTSPDIPDRPEGVLCAVCDFSFEAHDMVACPHHEGTVCSLCCSLEADCHDRCKVPGSYIQIAPAVQENMSPRV
ncbi:purine-cytosine permease family protein [Sulfobacillus thermosulfidooxidans]|uniref:purine-cytosine permease family protein n=1 Tax=Sulfobacillus thermosulfidooxidans TaxID=28034 RepID=UPI00096B9345|nr:hypothetical protein [Sulfobacillus thermosulfidooxidans]OLZ09084.1 hypothetical protein BFX05_02465 [Sulfobacillus thermosulfidooxidans]OLZ15162.1 hypothetical protein BFX06_04280 [Sulfobacillus thermosulfidooxidans]OLZ22151.1 hypothetical protein BFX07_09800 [Sulfobacillus thermosulfidooxidans]